MQYFMTAATSDQIRDLVASDPEKARRWGLIPSDEVKNALSLSALKEKYPNAKEEDLAQYISILLDENGNYRSTLYQKQMGSLADLNPATASMGTSTGISTVRDQFQRGEALRKSLLEEEDAYKQYTTPDVAFLRTAPDEDTAPSYTPPSYGKVDLSDKLKTAGGDVKREIQPWEPPKVTGTTTGSSTGKYTTATQAQRDQLSSMTETLKSLQKKLDAQRAAETTTKPPMTDNSPEAIRKRRFGY